MRKFRPRGTEVHSAEAASGGQQETFNDRRRAISQTRRGEEVEKRNGINSASLRRQHNLTMEDQTKGKAENDPSAEDEVGTNRAERKSRSAPAPPQPPQLKAKMLVAPLLLLGGKKLGIDYEVPEVLSRVRLAFMIVMALSLSACALMYGIVSRKQKKLSENKVEVRTNDPMAGGKEKVEILTHFEHDLREVGKAFTNQLFGFGVVGAMHIYMKVNPPLLLQTVMMPMNLWEMTVFQVHFLGKDTNSSPKFKRPWYGLAVWQSSLRILKRCVGHFYLKRYNLWGIC